MTCFPSSPRHCINSIGIWSQPVILARAKSVYCLHILQYQLRTVAVKKNARRRFSVHFIACWRDWHLVVNLWVVCFPTFPAFLFADFDTYVTDKHTGLDIGYVPAGPHAFLRLSGQFGPPQFIFHWPEGASVFFFFLVLRMPPLFLLGIGKTRKATLIRTYFSLYRPNVQKCATSRVKS